MYKMASRVGSRASGTDGSDFSHRETIALHYQRAVELKKKCKQLSLLQIISVFVLALTSLLSSLHPPSLIIITGYLIALPSIHFGLRRNSFVLVNIYGTCCVLLGVFPASYSLYKVFFKDASFLSRFDVHSFLIVVQCSIVMILNVYGAYLAKNLMVLWQPKSSSNNRV